MAGIGRDLVVNLAGNNAKLKSTIAESKGGLKGFASAATSMLNPITAGFAAVAAGAASAGVAVYMFAGRISELAGVADQSVQTGLDGAFLQRLGYAADQSGVSVETLTGGIKKLTLAIGKGDEKPFEAFGLSLAELKTMSPEEQFKRVAEALAKLPTASERAAAAVKIFGKSGIEMTGLFAGGMNDLNALLEDAASLGIGVSAEGLQRAADADDAIQRMKASFGALLDQLTVGVAPMFRDVSDYIAGWIPPLTEFIGKFNGLENKAKFVGDLFEAGMELALANIAIRWQEMLDDMLKSAVKTGRDVAAGLSSGNLGQIVAGIGGGRQTDRRNKGRLNNAQTKFDNVLGQLDTTPSTVAPPSQAKSPGEQKPEVNVAAIESLFGGIAESAKGIFSQVETAVTTKVTEAGITGNWFMKTAENMFTGDKKQQKTDAPKLSAAANKGSQEALRIAMRGTANTYETKALKWQEKAFEIAKQTLQATKDAGQQLVAEF